MKVLKALFNFYISSSIHVAIAVYALCWITLFEYNLPYDENCLYFVFFASISGYNFVKYFGLAKFHHRRLANWLRMIQLFSAVAFLLMCYYLFQLQLRSYILIGILALITFLYAVPFLPKHFLLDEQQNLREISGIKIYIIAFVWSAVTVLLPLVNNEFSFNADIWLTFFQRFCFVMILMLPFEIRDLNYDSLKLATIPQRIGIKKTKALGVLLLLAFVFLEFFKSEVSDDIIISKMIISIATLLFLMFSSKKQPKSYTALWVESLPIFWLILLFVIR